MLTENEGAKDSATLGAEADDGSEEFSVGTPAGEPPQAVRTAPSMSSSVNARGDAVSKLISFPSSPATNTGLLPGVPDDLGPYPVFLIPQTPQQLGQQVWPDNRLWELGQSKIPWFISVGGIICSHRQRPLEGPHSEHTREPEAP